MLAKSLGIGAIVLATALGADAQVSSAMADAAKASPELVGALSKEIGATPEQAAGAAGSLFGLAKSRLKAEDFAQVSKAVPGMDSLLKAAAVNDRRRIGRESPRRRAEIAEVKTHIALEAGLEIGRLQLEGVAGECSGSSSAAECAGASRRSFTWTAGSRPAACSRSPAVPPEASDRHDPPAAFP